MRADTDAPSRAEIARLAPAVLVLAVWVVLLPGAGGFDPRDWLPAGLFLLGLAALTMVANRRVLPPAGPMRVALLALAGYTLWSYASIGWSLSPGSGWDGANLLLVTLATGWIFALTPWRAESALTWALAFSVAVAAVYAVALIGSIGGGDLASRFESGRYNQPLEYANAYGALAVLAAIPGLVFAARPGGALPLKALGLAAGAFLLGAGLIAQSRGALLSGTVALLLVLALVPFRWRMLLVLVATLAAVAVSAGPVLDVYDVAGTTGRVTEALRSAAFALLGTALVAAVAGMAIGLLERRVKPTQETRDRFRAVGWGLTGLAVVLVVAAAALNGGRISGAVGNQWDALRNPGSTFGGAAANPDGQARFTTIDPIQRYDYWRVGIKGLLDAPLTGDGLGSFQHRYAAESRYAKPSKYAHNLGVRVLGETGLVGLVLWATWLGAVLFGLLRGWRTAGRSERALGAIALGAIAYMAVHASLDWLEVYPVISGPVLGLMVAALAVRRPVRAPATARRRLPAPVPALAAGLVLVAGAASLAAPWLSLRLEERASKEWRTDPDLALADLDRAARWNPLATESLQNRGLIAVQLGRLDVARDAFERSVAREPTWVPQLELALIAAQEGDTGRAGAAIDGARKLNRLEPVAIEAQRLIRSGKRVDAAAATRRLFESRTPSDQPLS